MAYYAFLDEDNIVTEVIKGRDEDDTTYDWEQWYGNFRGQVCKRTSYNTQGNIHLNGGTPFRKNYAGIGYYYDVDRDAFIPPKLYPSWTLNEETCLWEAPVLHPTDNKFYVWDEDTISWQEITE
jgi:hypothetical protein